MAATQSKTSRPSPAWVWAYALAALALAASLGLAWWRESRRPWQEEVRAIYQERARRLERRLRAVGLDPARIRARVRAVAEQPPRVIEITPQATGRPERCLTCHQGIEQISPSHPVEAVGCVACHGGQGLALTRAGAHRGLLPRNPSHPATARASCGGGGDPRLAGRCHAGRDQPAANLVYNLERTIMATMTGVLTSLRVAWGAQEDFTARYATAAVDDPRRPRPAPPFTLARLLRVPGGPPRADTFPALADEHWRKFCARCHLHAVRESGPSVHGAGCAACHGSRTPDGRYHGGDAAIPDREPGHAAYHRLHPTPPEENCLRCHNRSARIGLSFRGGMEDEGGRVPWRGGRPNQGLSGGRGLRRLLPDLHAAAGFTCIDCHTPAEIMGDGRLYGRMRHQTEIRCASCHGAPGAPPRLIPPDGAARYQTAYGPLKAAPSLTPRTRLAQSAKGRPLAAVRAGDKGLVLWLRSQPGKKRECKDISRDPGHNIPGHRRLACQSCHSRWTPQCYGCHDYRRADRRLWDYAAGRPTPGRWQETRDLNRFLDPVLGVDSRGRVRPLVPGCQVMLTVLDAKGRPQGTARRILRRGPAGNSIVSTPISPHTTRREVPRCLACHASPRRLGLGPGPRPLGKPAARPLSDLSMLPWPADWEALVNQDGRPLMGSTHQGARPLTRQEIARVLRFARCLPCHRRPQDPVVRDPRRAYRRIAKGGDLYQKHRRLEEKALR